MMGIEYVIPVPYPIYHLHMMTSSNGNTFRVTGPLCGEFTGPGEFPTQRPVTRSFDVLFDLRLNKRLSKQPWGWWFETPAWSLWRHRNDKFIEAKWRHVALQKLVIIVSGNVLSTGPPFTNTVELQSQLGWVITCPAKCGMEFRIH